MNTHSVSKLCFLLGFLGLFASTASAATLVVGDGGDYTTLNSAISAAVAGGHETIVVNSNGPFGEGGIIISGTPTTKLTIRAGVGYRPLINDVLFCIFGGDQEVELVGFDVIMDRPDTSAYGMIPSVGGSLTFTNCHLENSSATGVVIDTQLPDYWSAGKLSDSHALTLNNTTIKGQFPVWMGRIGKLVTTKGTTLESKDGGVALTSWAHVAGMPTLQIDLNQTILKAGALNSSVVQTARYGSESSPTGTFKAVNCLFLGHGKYDQTSPYQPNGSVDIRIMDLVLNHCTFRGQNDLDEGYNFVYLENKSAATRTANITNCLFDIPTVAGGTAVKQAFRYTHFSTTTPGSLITVAGDANTYNMEAGDIHAINAWPDGTLTNFETNRYTADGSAFATTPNGRLDYEGKLSILTQISEKAVATTPAVTVDLGGQARPLGAGPDIGADEWSLVPVELSTFNLD